MLLNISLNVYSSSELLQKLYLLSLMINWFMPVFLSIIFSFSILKSIFRPDAYNILKNRPIYDRYISSFQRTSFAHATRASFLPRRRKTMTLHFVDVRKYWTLWGHGYVKKSRIHAPGKVDKKEKPCYFCKVMYVFPVLCLLCGFLKSRLFFFFDLIPTN